MAVAPFIDSAYERLQQMQRGLNEAMKARMAGQPVEEELLRRFVQYTKELAASVNGLLSKGSENTEVSEDLLVGLANFPSRSTAGAAALAVVQNLTEGQRASPEAREMCVDYVDALLEGCLGVVQSLIAGLENVKALFDFERPPPPPPTRPKSQQFRAPPKSSMRRTEQGETRSATLAGDLPEPPAQGNASLGKVRARLTILQR
jgi:hypothetical protein